MNPLLSLTKGSNCMPSQKEGPIWGHNVVKTVLCKQVSKSVSLLAQGHKICSSLWITLIVLWETQSQSSLLPTSEGCFQARKEVVLKPWSITDVNLPEVTYHSTGTGHFSLKPSFFSHSWESDIQSLLKNSLEKDTVEENLWSPDNEMPFSLPSLLIFRTPVLPVFSHVLLKTYNCSSNEGCWTTCKSPIKFF